MRHMGKKRLGLAAALAGCAAAGSAETWVTSVRDRYPAVSPDGNHLLFESDRGGASGLYLLELASGKVRSFVLGDGGPSNGSWCPDGNRLVYNERVGGEFDVFIVNADGSGRRNLTANPADDGHPHCGPDGRIYFSSDRATPDRSLPWGRRNHDLYSIAMDGGDVRRLTDCRAVCTNPNPSPDGRRVAFRLGLRAPGKSWDQQPGALTSEIAVLDLGTGRIRNITNDPAYDTWPSWSPEGQWVVYGSNRDGVANVGHLFMTRADGSETRRLTQGAASYGEPRFTADGATLYFSKSLPDSDSRASFVASMPAPRS